MDKSTTVSLTQELNTLRPLANMRFSTIIRVLICSRMDTDKSGSSSGIRVSHKPPELYGPRLHNHFAQGQQRYLQLLKELLNNAENDGDLRGYRFPGVAWRHVARTKEHGRDCSVQA